MLEVAFPLDLDLLRIHSKVVAKLYHFLKPKDSSMEKIISAFTSREIGFEFSVPKEVLKEVKFK